MRATYRATSNSSRPVTASAIAVVTRPLSEYDTALLPVTDTDTATATATATAATTGRVA